MKCEECKKLIYLFDVLTSPEKESTDRHMLTCRGCREFHQQIEQERLLIKNAAAAGHKITDPERLTAQIMSALKPRKASSSFSLEHLLSIFDLAFPRYAMAAMSLLLIGSFLYEQQVPVVSQDRGKQQMIAQQRTGLQVETQAAALQKQRSQSRTPSRSFLNAASSLSFLSDKQFLQFTNQYLSKGKKNETLSLYRELHQCMQQCRHDERQTCNDCKIMLNQLIQKYESL